VRLGRHRVSDDGEYGADGCGLTLGDSDLGEEPGAGRWHLGIDLVGGDLKERLVGLDAVTDLLEPPRNRPFGDRLAQLRHGDVHERLLLETG
jgi:hypothetical protein